MRDALQLLPCRSKRNGAVLQNENIRHSTCFSDQVMFGSWITCTTVYDGNVRRRLSISPVRVMFHGSWGHQFPLNELCQLQWEHSDHTISKIFYSNLFCFLDFIPSSPETCPQKSLSTRQSEANHCSQQ
jgi:hypothetical protein